MQEVEKKGRAALHRADSSLRAGSLSYVQGGGRTRFSVTCQPFHNRLRVAVQSGPPRYDARVLAPPEIQEGVLLCEAPMTSWAGLWVLDDDGEPLAVCRLSPDFDQKAARPLLEKAVSAQRAGRSAGPKPVRLRTDAPAPAASRISQQPEAEPTAHCLRPPLYAEQPPQFYEDLSARFPSAVLPSLRAGREVSFLANGLRRIEGKIHLPQQDVLVQAVSAGNPVLRPPELDHTLLSEQGEVLWCRYDVL